jgi:hypothetical protein
MNMTQRRMVTGVASLVFTTVTVLAQMNVTFKEGTLESPEPGGGSNKFTYRQGAFYGYADKNQKSPTWYNMAWEMARPRIASGLRYTDEDVVQGYILFDVRASCDFDAKGGSTWVNLNPATTGVCYTGSIQSPTTNNVEKIEVSDGSLHLHLPAGANYYLHQQELTTITNAIAGSGRAKGDTGQHLKTSAGVELCTLFVDRKLITAGSKGLDVKVNLLNGELDVAEPLCKKLKPAAKK